MTGKIARFLLLLVPLLFSLSGCYVISQGVYLLDYNKKAEDISEVLQRDDLEPDIRRMLEEVLAIREYAEQELGLTPNKNYSRYVEVEKNYLVDVVTACEPDSFTAYTWTFPIVGEVPYKGFYTPEDAERLAFRLKEKGLDVIVRHVDAFSTLGFFSDPVYSFMKDYNLYDLADLVIHEQTHATIFLKDRIQFNEELATFVGRQGALQYLVDVKGEGPRAREEVDELRHERETFFELMRELYGALDLVYSAEIPRDEKLVRKEETLLQFRQDLERNYNERFSSDRYRFLTTMEMNNAYIMNWNIYTSDLDLYNDLYVHVGRDLKSMIAVLSKLDKSGRNVDPKEYIKELLQRDS